MHYNVGDFDLLTYIKNPEVFAVEGGTVKTLTGPGLGSSDLFRGFFFFKDVA